MATQFTRFCATCQIELKTEQNGIAAVEMAGFGPLAVWMGDLCRCPCCGAEVVLRLAEKPLFEHWRSDMAREIEALKNRGVRVLYWWLNEREKQECQRRADALARQASSG